MRYHCNNKMYYNKFEKPHNNTPVKTCSFLAHPSHPSSQTDMQPQHPKDKAATITQKLTSNQFKHTT